MKKIHFLLLPAMLAVMTILVGCKKSSESPCCLSPARTITGTWKSLVAVNVYEVTNQVNCYTDSARPLYTWNTFQCKFTFVISTYTGDTTLYVDVSIDTTSGQSGICGYTTPVDDGYPIYFHGVASSSALTLTDNNIFQVNNGGVVAAGTFDVGDFTYTTAYLTGKIAWVTYTGPGGKNCKGWKTDQISLIKQ
jgi:hypothetical protein